MAAVVGVTALSNIPFQTEISFAQASATGIINPGDWLAYTGQMVEPSNSGERASWKASGAGVALDPNPVSDRYGNSVQNSALRILVEGVMHVSASFSGQPLLGLGAYPDATGSGVYAATGATGVGATWNTAAPSHGSALAGTAAAQQAPVATVIGSENFSNAGTGELIIRLMALPADVRG